MRVGIIQSNYIPWRGYFDFIDSVDLFVFHDDIQFTKQDWRNRNKIKTARGAIWMTVPVYYRHTEQLICDTEIDYSQNWQRKHVNLLRQWYGMSPYFSDYIKEFEDALSVRYRTISDLNIALCRWVMKQLKIMTPTIMSKDLDVQGAKTERLIGLLKKAGAIAYLSGPSAKVYLDEDIFKMNNIRLEYKTYDYEPYPQLWGEFIDGVSVLDLLFNTGVDAGKFINSRKPDLIGVS